MALQATGIYGPGAAGRYPAGGAARQGPAARHAQDHSLRLRAVSRGRRQGLVAGGGDS